MKFPALEKSFKKATKGEVKKPKRHWGGGQRKLKELFWNSEIIQTKIKAE